MAEKIYYNSVDITSEVKAIAVTLEQYVGTERADSLEITFGEDDDWGSWKPQTDDRIRYTKDGSDSGTMYLYDVSIGNSSSTLYARSTPTSMRVKRSKAWERVYLTQIGQEVAARSGMSFELSDLSDQYYGYIKQEAETDSAFLSRLAMLEGAALVVFNDRIIMAGEAALESTEPSASIDTLGAYCEHYDRSNEAYGSAIVSVGAYKGVHVADSENSKQYKADNGSIQASSNAECMRFATGVLRDQNKRLTNLKLQTSLLPEVAAGITCELEDAPTGWSGSLFVHHVRHEFHKSKTTVFARKILEGY